MVKNVWVYIGVFYVYVLTGPFYIKLESPWC